jgi:hypothetical protein
MRPGDKTSPVAHANAARALIEASHARLAARREWVLNEKAIVARAGLAPLASRMLGACDTAALAAAIEYASAEIGSFDPHQ